jgi:hypothetical protein
MTGASRQPIRRKFEIPKSIYEGADIVVFSSCVVAMGRETDQSTLVSWALWCQDELRCGHWRG